MPFQFTPDKSIYELTHSFSHALDYDFFIGILVSCLLMVPLFLYHLNQENSAASEQRNTVDRRTLWNSLGFTDEIDRRDFGRYWEAVKELKYNNPSLKTIHSIIPRENDQSFCKEAWNRLGWYLAKNDFIEDVNCVCSKVITDEVFECMFGSVVLTPKESIKSMNFSCCSITSDGIKSLLHFIKAAPSITNFHIDDNNIGTDGFASVITSLCGSQIEILSLTDCAINNIIPSLTNCEFPQLREVDFSFNQIADKGADFIVDNFLQSCPKLEKLGLSRCGIHDRGAKSIANALASNLTLKKLGFYYNSISDEGVASFAKALHSNHTLTTLSMSRCTVGWSDTSTQYQNLQFALKMNNFFEKDLEKAKWVKEKYFAKGGHGLECAVCLQKKCDFFVFSPCMHKICNDCNDLYDKDICHTCREKIEKRRLH